MNFTQGLELILRVESVTAIEAIHGVKRIFTTALEKNEVAEKEAETKTESSAEKNTKSGCFLNFRTL